jgi:hypothetical protein
MCFVIDFQNYNLSLKAIKIFRSVFYHCVTAAGQLFKNKFGNQVNELKIIDLQAFI